VYAEHKPVIGHNKVKGKSVQVCLCLPNYMPRLWRHEGSGR